MEYFLEEMNTNINESKDVPIAGKEGLITALCLAIQNGAFEAAHFLIEKGAKVTPYTFYVAMKHNNEKLISAIVGKLREQGMGDYNLKEAVYNGRFERVESTPLMRACKYGCIQNIKMLLE
jgi:ankyrin repeat protein